MVLEAFLSTWACDSPPENVCKEIPPKQAAQPGNTLCAPLGGRSYQNNCLVREASTSLKLPSTLGTQQWVGRTRRLESTTQVAGPGTSLCLQEPKTLLLCPDTLDLMGIWVGDHVTTSFDSESLFFPRGLGYPLSPRDTRRPSLGKPILLPEAAPLGATGSPSSI